MKDERQRIIGSLRHKHDLTKSLGSNAESMLRKAISPLQFIEKVTQEANSEDCLRCNGQPFCDLFLGFAHLELGTFPDAQAQVEKAISGFHLRGLNWNEALSYWLFGMILSKRGDTESAKRSLQKAIGILGQLLKEYKLGSNYGQAKECEESIKGIQKTLRAISTNNQKRNEPQSDSADGGGPAADNSKNSPGESQAYIAVPWIPIYTKIEVEASGGGPARSGQDIKQRSQLETVNLEGKLYTIHSIRFGNRRIALSTGRQYGWVKVHGHSMNDAKPTPINENDFVLFYGSSWPDRNEIVIASKADGSAVEDSFSYMVKRYAKEEQQLKSETTKKGDQYNPVDITDEYRCLGIVVAVAKRKI